MITKKDRLLNILRKIQAQEKKLYKINYSETQLKEILSKEDLTYSQVKFITEELNKFLGKYFGIKPFYIEVIPIGRENKVGFNPEILKKIKTFNMYLKTAKIVVNQLNSIFAKNFGYQQIPFGII